MKNKIFTLLFALLAAFGLQVKAQVIADFETDVTANLQAAWGEVTDPNAFAIVDNPATDGINTSAKCLKVLQMESYKPWGNGDWYGVNYILPVDLAVDKTSSNHWLHFKYYCTTVGQQIKFEIYGDNRSDVGTGFIPTTTEADLGKWIEVIINLNFEGYKTKLLHNINIMPNNTYQTNARTADEITYFDDIVINDVAPAGFAILADFETDISANLQAAFGEVTDPYAFEIAENPVTDGSGVNTSTYCLKVLQKPSYKPWGNGDWYGIVLTLPEPVTMSLNGPMHFLHFKYYSETVGAQIGLELYEPKADLNSVVPRVTETDKWIDVAIDLNDVSALTDNKLVKIYICPNRRYQTDGNTADQITYFDDFEINNIAPVTPPTPAKAEVLADFEIYNPSIFVEDGITDPEAFEQVENPVKTGINPSANCLKVVHKPEFAPWGSADWFGAVIPFDPAIITDKTSEFHYLHYKYLAETIGATINIEVESPKISFTETVYITGEWIEVVIDLDISDFVNKTISLVKLNPNNSYQTNAHTENEIVYFDDIVINNVATATTGVKGISNTSKYSVYPNPASDVIKISDAAGSKLQILSVLGKEVKTVKVDANLQSINVSDLSKGIYLLRVTNNYGKSTTQKIMIK